MRMKASSAPYLHKNMQVKQIVNFTNDSLAQWRNNLYTLKLLLSTDPQSVANLGPACDEKVHVIESKTKQKE